MIVDSHMHVWSMDDVDYYDDKTIYQYMQENAVDKTAIIAISEKENAEMKKVVQNEPDKFFGLGYVNVRDMYPSLKKLEEGVKGGWIRGIKLYPYAEHFMLDDDAINPTEEEIEAEYQRIADMYQMDIAKVKELIDNDNISYDLRLRNAVKLIQDSTSK